MYHPRDLEAFEGTYEWIFKERKTTFPDWARGDDSVFWVTGKPGSGKSTLMNFISNHKRTRALLQEWAGDCRLTIAKFFFWNAGNKMQKSQKGLMQGLLHQIVYQSEDINFDQVAGSRKTDDDSIWQRPWTRKELSQALRSLLSGLSSSQRFCLFVDGLDEYELENVEEGNYDDLIEYLNALATSPSVKICVSSRPCNAFKNAYAGLGRFQICMNELTAKDMAIFMKSHLSEDTRFSRLLENDEAAAELIATIKSTAKGVFLWVSLAVKDIRRGLSEQDDLKALKTRIEYLPPELDELLERIFQSIEPMYKKLAARVLLLVLNHVLNWDNELLQLSFMEELVAQPSSAFTAQNRRMSTEEIRTRAASVEPAINKWCKGLVEVSYPSGGTDLSTGRVRLAHRTVHQFVHEKAGILEQMAGVVFSAVQERAKMMLHVVKGAPDPAFMRKSAETLLNYFRFEFGSVDYISLFEALDRACSIQLNLKSHVHWSSVYQSSDSNDRGLWPSDPSDHSAVSLALRFGLCTFAHFALSSTRYSHTPQQMHYILGLSLVSGSSFASFAIVDQSLRSSVQFDFNGSTMEWGKEKFSLWELFLWRIAALYGPWELSRSLAASWRSTIQTLNHFLELGADPDSNVSVSMYIRVAGLIKENIPKASYLEGWYPAKVLFGELEKLCAKGGPTWEFVVFEGSDAEEVPCYQVAARRFGEVKLLLEQASEAKRSECESKRQKTGASGQMTVQSRFRGRGLRKLNDKQS